MQATHIGFHVGRTDYPVLYALAELQVLIVLKADLLVEEVVHGPERREGTTPGGGGEQ